MSWLSVDPSSQVSSQFRPASVVRTGQAVVQAPSGIGLDAGIVPENTAAGFLVGTATATGSSVAWSLTNDASGSFVISAAGEVRTTRSFDFETETSFNITVRAQNSGGFIETSFEIITSNVNEASSTFSVSSAVIDGGRVEIDIALVGTPFCTISNNDPDAGDVQTFSLDTDLSGAISINPSTGIVTLDDVQGLNDGDDTFIVRSTDQGGLQSTGIIPVRIISTVVNQANAFTDGTNWDEAGDAGLWSDQIAA